MRSASTHHRKVPGFLSSWLQDQQLATEKSTFQGRATYRHTIYFASASQIDRYIFQLQYMKALFLGLKSQKAYMGLRELHSFPSPTTAVSRNNHCSSFSVNLGQGLGKSIQLLLFVCLFVGPHKYEPAQTPSGPPPCKAVFNCLKSLFTSDTVLAHPNESRQFLVQVNASDVAMGAVLLQQGEDGCLRPCVYLSKKKQ